MALDKEKLDRAIEIKEKVKKSIWSSTPIILERFILPMMIIILFFLGALQTMYPYESTLEEDLNASMGIMGDAFYSIYNVGAENPKWFYYFFVILGGLTWFTIEEVYHNIKEVWIGVGGMSAQEIIDLSDTKTELKGKVFDQNLSYLKGGNKYK